MAGKDPTLKNTLISAAYDAIDSGRYVTCAAMCELIEQLQTDEALLPDPWGDPYPPGYRVVDADDLLTARRQAREARGKPAVRLDTPPDEALTEPQLSNAGVTLRSWQMKGTPEQPKEDQS